MRHAVRLKLLEIYLARKDARSFETQASELYALTRGEGDEWEQAAAQGKSLDPGNPLYSMGKDGADAAGFGAAAALAAGGAAVAAAPEFGTDFGDTYAPAEPAPSTQALDLDLGQDAVPALAADDFSSDFTRDFASESTHEFNPEEAALPQAADASVSPASVAAEHDNLMDFDLSGLNFDPVPAPAPAAEASAAIDAAPAEADDMSLDFGLDLPAAATPAIAAEPAAATDPLELDLADFDIPEVPALTVDDLARAEPAPLEFDTNLDLPADIETITPAPPPAAPEFDLSSIDLDLDSTLGGGAAPSEAAPGGGEPLSAHHMEMDTKLDLAVAYQEIGDKEGARELLDEVLRGGNPEQIAKANAMMAQLG